ncbi:hypothetical protein RQP46_006100 [Phenoliferia psychrophenolica]
MLENPQSTSRQPRIASFAPELIDEILHHLVADLEENPALFPGPKAIADYALISRNWRAPVQRRLMSRLLISLGSQAKRVAEGLVKSGLVVHVRFLKIYFGMQYREEPTPDQISTADGVGREHFLALLPHFPALTSLDLVRPTFPHLRPSEIQQLKTSESLYHITSLSISTGVWHRDTDLVHAILGLTPCLTTLSLTPMDWNTILDPNLKGPVELPHLESLKLEGRSFASSLLELGLLTTDTIAQVTDLNWFDGTPNASAQPLLRTMGPSLKKLRYKTYNGGTLDIAAELQSCTVLEHLNLEVYNGISEGLIGQLPPTIDTLTLTDLKTAHKILVPNIASRSPSLKTVTLVGDFYWDHHGERYEENFGRESAQFAEIVKALKDSGVQLVGESD